MMTMVEYSILTFIYVVAVIVVNYLQSDKMTDRFWKLIYEGIKF